MGCKRRNTETFCKVQESVFNAWIIENEEEENDQDDIQLNKYNEMGLEQDWNYFLNRLKNYVLEVTWIE